MLGLFSKLNWRAILIASGAVIIPALVVSILGWTSILGFWTIIILTSMTYLVGPLIVGTIYGWIAQPFGNPFDLRLTVLGGLISALISALIINLMFDLFLTKKMLGTDTSLVEGILNTLIGVPPSAILGVLGSVLVAGYKSSQRIPVNTLLTELQNGNTWQRRTVLHKLSKSNFAEAVPALINASNDPDSFVRQDAINGLRRIGSEEALNYLESQGIPTKEYHSFWGIVSCVLPLIILLGVASNYPSFSLLGSVAGVFFLYCISPIGLTIGFFLSVRELRKPNQKKLFPNLGIFFLILATMPLLLEWVLALMSGAPFSLFG